MSLLPLLLAILHAVGLVPMSVMDRLDDLIYDARLRATMPATLEPRVVVVDIDEQSLASIGRWPWPRHEVARLVDTLFDEHGIALLGLDTVFAEADDSSGIRQLQALAAGELADQPGFAEQVRRLQPELDRDAQLARALKDRPVVLGYYFTSDRNGRTTGALPAPVMQQSDLQGRAITATQWDGYGANLPQLAQAAPRAGFFNAIVSADGVVRALPLLAEHNGQYYESLALAVFRVLLGSPQVEPGFPVHGVLGQSYNALESIRLRQGTSVLNIPVDERLAALVPYRGPGGPNGGSFHYVSASDVLSGQVVPGLLKGKIVLLGTTAPGLLDLRVTPVGEAYPGVETHANLIASLLDGRLINRPDYALGYELVVLVLSGLLLAVALPLLTAVQAVALSLAVVSAVVVLNTWLYLGHSLVLPLASSLVMIGFAFALNMSYGYLVESRSKRQLAQLFGTYVPPALVTEMLKDPGRYSMTATERELTVMFCDMRGFTQLSESMQPTDLQALLNTVFSRLTQLIRQQRGTIDKYMGDCVMAFWGAPVESRRHAPQAVEAALNMVEAVNQINRDRRADGLPAIGVGIGLNTGVMSVGDMGSDVRRSYTVIGDAVNLGSRLEALSRVYGVDIVVSAATCQQAPEVVWQWLDRVRVKGKAQAVDIYTPLCRQPALTPELAQEHALWESVRQAWLARDWSACEHGLAALEEKSAEKVLYRLYRQRIALVQKQTLPPDWDGTTVYESK